MKNNKTIGKIILGALGIGSVVAGALFLRGKAKNKTDEEINEDEVVDPELCDYDNE